MIKMYKKAGAEPPTFFCAFRSSLTQKTKSMIIICKSPDEIKHFISGFSHPSSPGSIQQYVQSIYASACFDLEKRLWNPDKQSMFFRLNDNKPIAVSLVHCSDIRTFIVTFEECIILSLYRLRSKDGQYSENVLMEPFFPGMRTHLLDIYGILSEVPRIKAPDSYRFSSQHTKQIRRDIRSKYRNLHPELFDCGKLIPQTFEQFYKFIHSLNAEQLQTLFGTPVTFC